jgi:alkylation response protein AidB-like acyl-CoA dehydrogenase
MTEVLEQTILSTRVRDEVRAFLAESWKPDMPQDKWREILADSGWAMPWWPTEYYGRGLPIEATRIVAEEFAKAGAPGPMGGMGVWLAGPTIVEHASHELKKHFLRRIITGEDIWCQLFSEPGSGSDLAGSQTTAVLHGDEWIVNGQKVWTSGAQAANMGMLVARTDWDVPKHQGISYLLIDMKQPGVDVRPLKQMSGASHFNEVFFSDARVPKDHVVGGVNDGWKVAMTTLMHERASIPMVGGQRGGMPAPRPQTQGNGGRGQQDEQQMMMAMMGRGWQGIRDLAREQGRSGDPVVRQNIVKLYVLHEVNRLNLLRAGAARKSGRPPGPEGSLAKLHSSAIARASRETGMAILGAGGMLTGTESPSAGMIQMNALSSPSSSIAGGTDEIQHNILGERVLGLPKEPQVDRDIAFRDVKRNVQKGSV